MRGNPTSYLLIALILVLVFSLFGIFNERFKELQEKQEKLTGSATDRTLSTESRAAIDRIIAISLSPDLAGGIDFGTITTLPSPAASALGNNYVTGVTIYDIEIDPSSTNVDVDFCIKASNDLDTSPSQGTPIILSGYRWSNNTIGLIVDGTNPPGPTDALSLRTDYEPSQEAVSSSQPDNVIYYRFYLDVPAGIRPGQYTNTVFFKALATDPLTDLTPATCGS